MKMWKKTLFSIGISLLAGNESICSQKKEFYSQASQDRFVYTILYEILSKQDGGSYLEIGAGHPIFYNNTYWLEKNLKWKGISVDIDAHLKSIWDSNRTNSLLIGDATCLDYQAVLAGFPPVIDYLSLDVDDNYHVVLEKIPFDQYIFKIITIEHDFYRYGDAFREKEREILTSLGYYCLFSDVGLTDPPFGSYEWPFGSFGNWSFEDWWIHPSAFSPEMLSQLTALHPSSSRSHKEVIEILKHFK